MAQSGYTPISLYFSATGAAVPTAPNLVAGELALNTNDGKLYYKNSSGVVTLLASATTVTNSFSAGTTGLTPNTATTGAVTLAGTLAVANGGTGLTAGTSGGVLAYTATGTLASSTALAASALVIGGGAGAAPSTTTTGTGVVTALGVNVGTAGAFVVNGGALGTPSSGTVTNLTGTASININGTVGATTPGTGAFTTLSATGVTTVQAGTAALPAIVSTTGTADTGLWFPAADTIAFSTAGTERARIDSAGNLGLGVTPSAWTTFKVLQVGNASLAYNNNNTYVGANWFYDGTSKYIAADHALLYSQENGVHGWFTAPSGANANDPISFTQAMTLDASGNLGIGTTSPSSKLSVVSTNQDVATFAHSSTSTSANNGGALIRIQNTSSTNGNMQSLHFTNASGSTSSAIFGYNADQTTNEGFLTFGTRNSSGTFNENMRLDSSGNLGVGTTSPSTYSPYAKLSVLNGIAMATNAVEGGSLVGATTTGTELAYLSLGRTYNLGSTGEIALATNGAKPIVFGTNSTERARIDSSGNLLVGVATANANGGVLQLKSGITFPATAVAATDANTLDDYEEGTFTPVISGTSTAGTGTYTQQVGAYVKIGKMVQYQIYIILTAHTGTGDIAIGGLPFTASAGFYPPAAIYVNNLALTALNYPQIAVATSSTDFLVRQVPTGGGAAVAIPMDTAFDILLSGTYQV